TFQWTGNAGSDRRPAVNRLRQPSQEAAGVSRRLGRMCWQTTAKGKIAAPNGRGPWTPRGRAFRGPAVVAAGGGCFIAPAHTGKSQPRKMAVEPLPNFLAMPVGLRHGQASFSR